MGPLSGLLDLVLRVYFFIIVAYVVLSMLVSFQIVNPRVPIIAKIGNVLYRLSEPALRPIRRFLPTMAGFDFSPSSCCCSCNSSADGSSGSSCRWASNTMADVASSPVSPVAGGVRLRLKVQPRARRNRIAGLVTEADGHQALKVAVTAAPESGAANDAVIALLAKELQLAKSALSLVAGATDRRKIIKLTGDPQQLGREIREWIEKLESKA